MDFYSYRFETVDIEGNVDFKGGAASFESDKPLEHLVRGAQIRLRMKPLPHNHRGLYWVVRVLIQPELDGYDVAQQKVFVQVRAVDEEK